MDYVRLFHALCRFAPYCGTGHKTTFGLGVTRLEWSADWNESLPTIAEMTLGDRVQALSEIFLSQRVQRGERVRQAAELWATVYARHERGESLTAIADDLALPYASVKTYSKLARRALRQG